MREELLEILNDKVKMDLPETLIDQEVDMAKREVSAAKQTDEAGDSAKFDEKAARKDSERRVKLGLILAEWGTQNKVAVTNEDLQQAIWQEAARYPDPQQVFEFYNKNPNALSMMRGMLFERKALDAMMAVVKTKDKSVKPEELFKQAPSK
jgi:trigger factor